MLIQPQKEIFIPIPLKVGMKGLWRIQCIRPDGRVRVDTGWFPNKILNNGRNNMVAQSNWLTWCHLGTGSTTPVADDSQLEGFVVSSSTALTNLGGTEGNAPYYGWRRKTWRFEVGAGQGGQNLSEVGAGWNSAGSTLVSRGLIIDSGTGLPTTVTPLVDELVNVTYELRYYPPLNDVANSVGLFGTNYDTITRAALVTNSVWSDYIGTSIGLLKIGNVSFVAYNGVLGAITEGPTGTNYNIDEANNAYNLSYSNNSYERVMIVPCGPLGWNAASGIRSVRIYTTAGAYQTQFSSNPGGTTIPKTSSYTMVLGWTLGWTEYI